MRVFMLMLVDNRSPVVGQSLRFKILHSGQQILIKSVNFTAPLAHELFYGLFTKVPVFQGQIFEEIFMQLSQTGHQGQFLYGRVFNHTAGSVLRAIYQLKGVQIQHCVPCILVLEMLFEYYVHVLVFRK